MNGNENANPDDRRASTGAPLTAREALRATEVAEAVEEGTGPGEAPTSEQMKEAASRDPAEGERDAD